MGSRAPSTTWWPGHRGAHDTGDLGRHDPATGSPSSRHHRHLGRRPGHRPGGPGVANPTIDDSGTTGFWVDNGQVTGTVVDVEGITIESTEYRQGIGASAAGGVTVSDSTFTGNDNGAIYVEDAPITVTDCTFTDNSGDGAINTLGGTVTALDPRSAGTTPRALAGPSPTSAAPRRSPTPPSPTTAPMPSAGPSTTWRVIWPSPAPRSPTTAPMPSAGPSSPATRCRPPPRSPTPPSPTTQPAITAGPSTARRQPHDGVGSLGGHRLHLHREHRHSDGGAIEHGLWLRERHRRRHRSTFDDNIADTDGGAIDNADNGGTGTLTATDDTFTGNTGQFFGDGGAIDNADNAGTGTLTRHPRHLLGQLPRRGRQRRGHRQRARPGRLARRHRHRHVGADIFAAASPGTSCAQGNGSSTFTDEGANAGSDSTCFNGGTGDTDSAGSGLPDLLGPSGRQRRGRRRPWSC